MAENVIILGAGASKASGAPLMKDFLDVADKMSRHKVFGNKGKEIQIVFDAFSELNKIFAKSTLDIRNIETFFGAVEMARIIGRFGNYKGKRVQEIYDGLISLIVGTLENSVLFEVNPEIDDVPSNFSARYSVSGDYREFVGALIKLGIDNSAVITFNYDIALDFQLHAAGKEINYCLSNEYKKKSGIMLLKLHGSINWGLCNQCEEIIPFKMEDYFKSNRFKINKKEDLYKYLDRRLGDKHEHATLHFRDNLSELYSKHDIHKDEIYFSPAIIPPTWTKSQYRGTVANVWKVAAEQLCDAKNIYVIGYSLPETDAFFRYLYALGSIGATRIERFWVFNSSMEKETFERYRSIIGDTVEERFIYFPKRFADIAMNFNFQDPKYDSRCIGYFDDYKTKITRYDSFG